MTNEDAIKRIDYYRSNCDGEHDCDRKCDLCNDALDMEVLVTQIGVTKMCDDEKTMLNPMLELVELKNAFDGAIKLAEDSIALAQKINSDLRDCRNELCLRCGRYQTSYKGDCLGCRWENIG